MWQKNEQYNGVYGQCKLAEPTFLKRTQPDIRVKTTDYLFWLFSPLLLAWVVTQYRRNHTESIGGRLILYIIYHFTWALKRIAQKCRSATSRLEHTEQTQRINIILTEGMDWLRIRTQNRLSVASVVFSCFFFFPSLSSVVSLGLLLLQRSTLEEWSQWTELPEIEG